MKRPGKKRAHAKKSVYPGITPRIASAGVQEALKVLEGRWKLTILFELFDGRTLRFSELERATPGVTQKMLIQQLRDLERDGIVSRIVHPVVPPKVEYRLTSGGEELCPALDELLFWAQRWKGQPTSAEQVVVGTDKGRGASRRRARRSRAGTRNTGTGRRSTTDRVK